jgi:hypothetical protein
MYALWTADRETRESSLGANCTCRPHQGCGSCVKAFATAVPGAGLWSCAAVFLAGNEREREPAAPRVANQAPVSKSSAALTEIKGGAMGQLTRRVARQDAASAAFWSQIGAVARRALRGSAGRAPGYSASRVSHG